MFYQFLAGFAFTFALASAQEANVDDNGSMDFLNQNRQSGDWTWPTYEMVFSELYFPDYMIGLHRPYNPVIMPQGLKTGASTAAAIVDRRCALQDTNCYVGHEESSMLETMRLDHQGTQQRIKSSMGMFGQSYPFSGWTARSTVDQFLWNAVPGSYEQLITVVRDPAERIIAAWDAYRNTREVFDMDLGDFIEKAYYDEDFREKLALPQYAALDAISRELVGKSFPYGSRGFAKRFGEHVIGKVLSGDWLLMVADRFEESVYTYMRKAYGFEWYEMIHDTPNYRSADELMSTLTSDQISMLQELQPYDYLLHVAANVFLDNWQYRLMNQIEQYTIWGLYEDDDDDDDNNNYYYDDDDNNYYYDDDDDMYDDYHDDDDDSYDDDDDHDDDKYDVQTVDCDYYRWAISHGYKSTGFDYNHDEYNNNYFSTGGYDLMSAEYCFMLFMQEDIQDTCDSTMTTMKMKTKKQKKHQQAGRDFEALHDQLVQQQEEEEVVPFLAYSKAARDLIQALKKSEQSEELTMNINKLKNTFGRLTVDAKKAMVERKKQAASGVEKEEAMKKSEIDMHKEGLGTSKSYYSDNLETFERNMCDFYKQNHHAMMSYSQQYHHPKNPEGMYGYMWDHVYDDFLDY